jgi:DNA replication and repair protein RecF
MLTQIELTNFRNYSNKLIEFNNKTTIITGKNAIGKTNILEAIFTNLFTKSFRTQDKDLININNDYFRLQSIINKTPINLHYTTLPKPTKTLKIHTQKSTLKNIIGRFPVAIFEPNTILLFALNSSYRRKYLDILLYQLDQQYIQNAIIYNKTIKQRNSWLRTKKIQGIKPPPNEQINIYDIQLATSGAYLTKSRANLLKKILPLLQENYIDIASEDKNIEINFIKSNTSEEDLHSQMQLNWKQDIAAGRTLIGPHREDFSFSFNGKPVDSFASRGELRSVLLALKFSELELFKEVSKNSPLLLLDDVFSELDESRQRKLINHNLEYQTIITATHLPNNIKADFQHIELV